jgi:uncharacterized protein (TIGR02594 family)
MKMDRRQKNAYAIASEQIGMKEISGAQHNDTIVEMFADVGHSWVKDDETAWCAAAIGSWLKQAGLPHTGKLNARSYTTWGETVDLENAQPGDVVVFWRGSPDGWQGHVGFFVRNAGTHIEVLGGNQSNAVNIARYPISRLLSVRRWKAANKKPSQKPHTSPRAPITNPTTPRKPGLLTALLRLFRRRS